MDVLDESDGGYKEIYPLEVIRIGGRPPEELLDASPRPAPILLVLLIVFWLWVPFLASVVFLVIILVIFLAADNPQDLCSLRASFSGVTSAGESLGLKRLWRCGGWDGSSVAKIWNQLMDSSPALQGITRDGLAVAATQVDWLETPDAHVFKADMPGLKKEDVRVEVEGDSILQISGQRDEDENKSMHPRKTWHRIERSKGRFLRRFQLPVNSEVDEVQARVENGVLTVTVPKRRKNPVAATRAVLIR